MSLVILLGEQVTHFIKNVFHIASSAFHANLRKVQDSMQAIFVLEDKKLNITVY